MRLRAALLAAAAVLLGLFYLGRGEGPDAAGVEGPRAQAPPTLPRERPRPDPAAIRNVFEYADPVRPELPEERVPAHDPEAPLPAAEASAPPEAVRLVGYVRRGGRVWAALAISGEVVVLGAGESSLGWTVEEIDLDAGVRVRGPGSEALLLAPPD